MPNRKRNHQIIFRVTDDEYEKIQKQIEKSGRSQQEFLIQSALNKEMVVLPKEEIAKAVVELSRQGNNLNQIAKKINQGSEEYSELMDMAKEFKKLWQQLRSLVQKQE